MTTPKPTAADKSAAEQISCEWDLDNGAREPQDPFIADIIAAAMAPEREALRLAKEALQLEIDRYLAEGEVPMVNESRRIRLAKEALAAIEKVEG